MFLTPLIPALNMIIPVPLCYDFCFIGSVKKSQILYLLAIREGDQSRTPFESEIRPCPLHHHQNAALKINQIPNMNHPPEDPCQKTARTVYAEIRYCEGPSHGGQITLVRIVKRVFD